MAWLNSDDNEGLKGGGHGCSHLGWMDMMRRSRKEMTTNSTGVKAKGHDVHPDSHFEVVREHLFGT